MILVIVHYHLRRGGIRRVIELAMPHLLREAPRPITRMVLACGERVALKWQGHFARQLSGVRVKARIEASFNNLSETRGLPEGITARIRQGWKNVRPFRR